MDCGAVEVAALGTGFAPGFFLCVIDSKWTISLGEQLGGAKSDSSTETEREGLNKQARGLENYALASRLPHNVLSHLAAKS